MPKQIGIVGPDGKIVTVTTDGSKQRLDVKSTADFSGTIKTFDVGTKVNKFVATSPSSHPTTLVSHTVATGKNLYIENWQAGSVDNIKMVLEFRIGGVVKDKFGFHTVNKNNYVFKPFGIFSPIKAASGVVVEIVSISGDTDKEVIISFNGTEI